MAGVRSAVAKTNNPMVILRWRDDYSLHPDSFIFV
jgi:hypothetical protein